jgi:hypothetical protein
MYTSEKVAQEIESLTFMTNTTTFRIQLSVPGGVGILADVAPFEYVLEKRCTALELKLDFAGNLDHFRGPGEISE